MRANARLFLCAARSLSCEGFVESNVASDHPLIPIPLNALLGSLLSQRTADASGATPLHAAAQSNAARTVEWLIKEGVEVRRWLAAGATAGPSLLAPVDSLPHSH